MNKVHLLSESETREYIKKSLPEVCIVVAPGYDDFEAFDEDSASFVRLSSLEVLVFKDDYSLHYVCVSSTPNKLDWVKYASELWVDEESRIYDEHGVVNRDGEVEVEGEDIFDGRNVLFSHAMVFDGLTYRLKEPIRNTKTLVYLWKSWNGYERGEYHLMSPLELPPSNYGYVAVKAGDTTRSVMNLKMLNCYGISLSDTIPYLVLVENG